MVDFRAGNFKADISDPYPMWISVTDSSGGEIKLSHDELLDLVHTLNRTLAYCRHKLPDSMKAEVD